ncbi:hypothetical protein [Streptomyces sp. CBMA123]|uniref:hypothetical protein n=1 Tax=Streptomyces sp. CBMA123 TaxID=1896313 RepID=UPI001661FB68|nr:hypothetical protein [Streptomyces sp. CBMA123]MBD0689395.1 hypothetical protein [Streptomyces sp. CBMA123]
MPRSSRFIRISAAVGVVGTLAALSAGCSSGPGASRPSTAQPNTVSASSTEVTTVPAAQSSATPPSTSLPANVEQAARAFTTAYAEHDARDGKDSSFADAGARASQLASGDLVAILSQKRPGQDAAWATLRAEKARQTVEITSSAVPDGAPAPTQSVALVRVGYTLTTAPASGPEQRSGEQLALRLEHTSQGWRVTALPWA